MPHPTPRHPTPFHPTHVLERVPGVVADDLEWRPSQYWRRSLVTASFPSTWNPDDIAASLQLCLGLDEPPEYEVEAIQDGIDWVSLSCCRVFGIPTRACHRPGTL